MSFSEAIALLCSVLASVVGNLATHWIADAHKSRARIVITTVGASAVVIILVHWHLGRAEENRAWMTTASSVSLARYCDYVRRYPTGAHVERAVQRVRDHIGPIIDAYRARSSGHESAATIDMLAAVETLCTPIVLVYSGEQNPRGTLREYLPHYVVDPYSREVVGSNWARRDKEHEQALTSDLQAAFLRAFGEEALKPQVTEATSGESSVIQLSVQYLESGIVSEDYVWPKPAPGNIFYWRPVHYHMDYMWHFGVRFPSETQDRYSMDFKWSNEFHPILL